MPGQNPIYDFMKANKLTDKDEKTFLLEYSDPNKAKEIHAFFQANKLTDKNFDSFYGEYLKKKEVSGPMPKPAPTGSVPGASATPSTASPSTEGSGLVPTGYETQADIEFKKSWDQVNNPASVSQFDQNDPVKSTKDSLYGTSKLLAQYGDRKPSTESTGQKMQLPVAAKEDIAATERDARVKKFSSITAFDEAEKLAKEVEGYYRGDTNNANVHLMKLTGIQDPNQFKQMDDKQLEALIRPGNETDKLSIDRIKDARDISVAMQSGRNLEEMAVYFAGIRDPQIARQIELGTQKTDVTNMADILKGVEGKSFISPQSLFSEASIGKMMYDMLSNSATVQEIQKSPEMMQQYRAMVPNLINKYPDFGKMYIGNIISQKMEEMGMNNAILNVVTKDEMDKVVAELEKEGKFGPTEKRFYLENLRESGLKNLGRKIMGREYIDTPGLLENTLSSGVKGIQDFGTGTAEITGARQFLVGEKEIVARDMANRDLNVMVKPKGIWHEVTNSGGQFLGQSLSIGLGGRMMNAYKIIKSADQAAAVMGGLQAYANYIPQARQMFPGEELKQRGYATILATMEMATENIFKDRKVIDGLMGKMKPAIRETIQDFTDKKITSLAAREMISNGFMKAVKDIPEAAKFFTKAVGENTTEEVVIQLATQVTNGVFTGKPLADYLNAEELLETAKQAALGSPFIGVMSARADMMQAKGVTAKNIYEMAQNPEFWKAKIQEAATLDEDIAKEAPDKIANLEYAAGVLKDIADKEMSDQQKIKYVITSLEAKVKGDQTKGITDPVVKKQAMEVVKSLQTVQEEILTGKDNGAIEGDVSEDELPAEVPAKEEVAPITETPAAEPVLTPDVSIDEEISALENELADLEMVAQDPDQVDDQILADIEIGRQRLEELYTQKQQNENPENTQQEVQPDTVTQSNQAVPAQEISVQQPVQEPVTGNSIHHQEYTTPSGSHTVKYENGNRKVYKAQGTGKRQKLVEVPMTITKQVNEKGRLVMKQRANPEYNRILLQHAKEYNYNVGEKAIDKEPPPLRDEQEYGQWAIENSNNPSEIAALWKQTPRLPPALSMAEEAIANVGVGKVSRKSFLRFGDRNWINRDMAEHYFGDKGKGKVFSIDQIALEASNYDEGVQVTPKDVVEFMLRFPRGVDPNRLEKTDVHRNAEKKFMELTGIPLDPGNGRNIIADIAASKYLGEEVLDNSDFDFGDMDPSEIGSWYRRVEENEKQQNEKYAEETTPGESEGQDGTDSGTQTDDGGNTNGDQGTGAATDGRPDNSGQGTEEGQIADQTEEENYTAEDFERELTDLKAEMDDDLPFMATDQNYDQSTKEAFDKVTTAIEATFKGTGVLNGVKVLTGQDFTNAVNAARPGEQMAKPDGTVYGFIYKGVMVLNGDVLNTNTPVHEASHLFTKWAKANSPELYAAGQKLAAGSNMLAWVKKQKFYQDQAARMKEAGKSEAEIEEMYRDEAMAFSVGNRGSQIANEEQKSSFRQWLRKFWDKIKGIFKGAKSFENMTAAEFSNMTFDEFSTKVAERILKGQGLKTLGKSMVTNNFMTLPNGRKVMVKNIADATEIVNGFYSPTENAIHLVAQNKMSGNQWRTQILSRGAKKEELVWTGLEKYFEDNKATTVSKDDILSYLRENRIEIKEIVKSDSPLFERFYTAVRNQDGDFDVFYDGQLVDTFPVSEGFTTEQEAIDGAINIADPDFAGDFGASESAKYEKYQLVGEKENYREILVTLPSKNQLFKSGHFDEDNILVHLRLNERYDNDNNKVLFVEEVQSDWGQEGKKTGFYVPGKSVSEFEQEMKEKYGNDWSNKMTDSEDEYHDSLFKNKHSAKSAPFVTETKSWVSLGLKVAAKEAVKSGADKIAWTTGDQQNDRYDLSKQVKHLNYWKEEDGTYGLRYMKPGRNSEWESLGRRVPANKLQDHVGKEVAEKILNRKEDSYTFNSLDLKLEGKGMKAFYGTNDNNGIIGSVAESVFSEKVSTTEINGEKQPSITISDTMRQSIEEGMPMFMAAQTPTGERIQSAVQKALAFLPESQVRASLKAVGYSDLLIENIIQNARRMPKYRPIPKSTKTGTIQKAPDITEFNNIETPTWSQRFKKNLRKRAVKNFTINKGMPEFILPLAEKTNGIKDKTIQDAFILVKKLKYAAEMEGFTDWDAVDNVLRSLGQPNSGVLPQTALGSLPAGMQPLVQEMRTMIDSLSKDLIVGGHVLPEQALTIEKNIGSYMTRAYRAYNEKDWFRKIPEKIKQDAVRLFYQQHYADLMNSKNPPSVDDAIAQAKEYGEKRVREIIEGIDTQYMPQKVSTIKGRDNKILTHKKDVPKEIRDLLGEYTDPGETFMMTVAKMATLKSQAVFLSTVQDLGMGTMFWEKDDVNRPAGTIEFRSEGSKTWNPLSGLYTTPDVQEFFDQSEKLRDQNLQMWMTLVGAVRWGKTVGSIVTQIKNFESNFGFALMNGHLRIDKSADSWSYLWDKMKWWNGDKIENQVVDDAARQGLIGQSVSARELKDMFNSSNTKDIVMAASTAKKGLTRKILNSPKQAINYANKLYSASDDFFKIYGFVNERIILSKARYGKKFEELTAEEKNAIDNEAVERVKNTYPTYDRVWEGAKVLSKSFPIFGNFLAFQAESVRVMTNTFKYTIKDLKDPQMRAAGKQRAFGIMAYLSFRSAALYGLAQLTGFGMTALVGGGGDEEDKKREAINRFVLPFMRSGEKLVIDKGNGKYTVFDLLSLEPYSIWFRTLNATKSGSEDIVEPGALAAMSEFFGVFGEQEMTFETFMQAKNNDDGRGGKIVEYGEGLAGNTQNVIDFVWKKLKPSTIGFVERFNADTWKDNMLAAAGARPYELDMVKAFSIKMQKYSEYAIEIEQDRFMATNKAQTKEEALKAGQIATERMSQLQAEIQKDAEAAIYLGADPKLIKARRQSAENAFIDPFPTGSATTVKPVKAFNEKVEKRIKTKKLE